MAAPMSRIMYVEVPSEAVALISSHTRKKSRSLTRLANDRRFQFPLVQVDLPGTFPVREESHLLKLREGRVHRVLADVAFACVHIELDIKLIVYFLVLLQARLSPGAPCIESLLVSALHSLEPLRCVGFDLWVFLEILSYLDVYVV